MTALLIIAILLVALVGSLCAWSALVVTGYVIWARQLGYYASMDESRGRAKKGRPQRI